jgi:23S rRNA pseudouridine2605 synthase
MQGRRHLPHNIIRTISKSGLCSRKQALELVMACKVKINGRTITNPGYKATKSDHVLVNEKPLPKETHKIYILFHKPAGYVTTRKDELNRPTVYEFIKDIGDWVFPVGRLDRDSEGLLIFTNDTKFGNVLTEPRFKIERTYHVLITGHISQEDIANMLKGVDIGRNEKSQPISVKIASKNDDSTWVEVSLKEGKNREIRRLFEALDRPVKRLIRTKFGPFSLGSIKPGKWIEFKEIPPEISKLIK